MKFPRMDWYPWDFNEDRKVRLLTWQERGAYALILQAMWQWADEHDTVDFPDSDWDIAGATGIPYEDWMLLRQRLVDHPFAPLCLDSTTHVIYSPRLREEYIKALQRHEGAQLKGGKGGRSKNSNKPTTKPQLTSSLAPANPELSPSKPHLSLITNQDQEKDLLLPRAGANDKTEPLPPHENAALNALPLTERSVTPDVIPDAPVAAKPLAGQWASLETAWMQYCHGSLPRSLFDELPVMLAEAQCPDLDMAVVIAAFREADRHNARTWAYVRRIVERWLAAGLTTLAAVEADLVAQGEKRAQSDRHAAHGPRDRPAPSFVEPPMTENDKALFATFEQVVQGGGGSS